MKEMELIQEFEPVFREAAQLAKNLRKDAVISRKSSTGIDLIDIVTSSDLTVQEFILKKLAATELNKCEIVAEEKTPSVNLFSKKADLVITLDPIDGTKNYATGKTMYSTIVSLHNKKVPLYTYLYFPEIEWGFRITDKVEFFGNLKVSPVMIASDPSNIIGYSNYSGVTDPEKTDKALFDSLTRKGFVFAPKEEIGKVFGPVQFFINGITAGIFAEDESAVDGLVALHYALATGCTVYNHMNISKPVPSSFGGSDEYKGYYIAIRK